MWLYPGANHAPHHSPKEYVDKYKGKFDDGYEAYREWVLPRMIEKGVMPKGTQLTPINPMPEKLSNPGDAVRPWASLSADEKKLFSRMAEVYAGFSEYTDVEVGRLIDISRLLVSWTTHSCFIARITERRARAAPAVPLMRISFSTTFPDEISENLKYLDVLGGVDTYGHYPTGWAVALSTPFQMFKRYSNIPEVPAARW